MSYNNFYRRFLFSVSCGRRGVLLLRRQRIVSCWSLLSSIAPATFIEFIPSKPSTNSHYNHTCYSNEFGTYRLRRIRNDSVGRNTSVACIIRGRAVGSRRFAMLQYILEGSNIVRSVGCVLKQSTYNGIHSVRRHRFGQCLIDFVNTLLLSITRVNTAKHIEQCGSKRIDVERGREGADVLFQFQRRIALGIATDALILFRFAINEIHSLTEVYQYRFYGVAMPNHHDIVGLDVEMQDVAVVQIRKSTRKRQDDAFGLRLLQCPTIYSVVLLEHLVHGHYVVVLERVQNLSLGLEVGLGILKRLLVFSSHHNIAIGIP